MEAFIEGPFRLFEAAEHQQPPCSYRLLYDEQKKCAFGSRDAVELLKRKCLRDGGHP